MKNRNKIFTSLAVIGSAIFAMVLTAGSGVFETLGLFLHNKTTTSDTYSLTLNAANHLETGKTSKFITTDSGSYVVKFSYYNCSYSGDAHVVINNEGTVKNSDHILSITSIYPVFSSSSEDYLLKFRASYDGIKWGEYASLTSEHSFDLSESKPYYIELKAFGGPITLTSCKYNYSCTENSESGIATKESWNLVTSDSEITVNDQYVIAALEDDYALSKTRNDKGYMEGTSFTPVKRNPNGSISISNQVEILTLMTSTYNSEYYSFKTSSNKHLNAAANNKISLVDSVNQYSTFQFEMWTPDAYNDPSKFIAGDALIQCQSSSNNSYLVYDSEFHGFSCYAPVGGYVQGDSICVYKKSVTENVPVYGSSISAVDASSNSYHTGDIFDNLIGTENGLNVTRHYSDGSSVALAKSNFEYVIKTGNGVVINSTIGFTSSGTYYVTITDKSFGYTYSYSINVYSKPVTAIALNQTSFTGSVGDTLQLQVTSITPADAENQTITWSSSDNNVATVTSSGLVKSLSAGNVTITATANGGNGVTASCVCKFKTSGSVEEYQDPTDFTKEISGFNDWGNSYTQKTINADYGTITLASASKQTGTITDMPVTKGGNVFYEANEGYYISGFDFECQQWNDKGQTITLNIKKDENKSITKNRAVDGYETTTYTSTNFSLIVDQLEDEFITAICFSFSNSSNQVGIKSLDVDLFQPSTVNVPVTGMSVSPATASVFVGNTTTLTPTIVPADASNKAINWTSDNETVATVSNGVVTGVSEGTANITAVSVDGGFTSTSKVTVNNKPVTEISLNKTEANMYLEGSDLQLAATVNSDATIQTITWESTDETVATVDATGKIHAVAEGSTIITATANGGLTATCSITVLPVQQSGEGDIVTIEASELSGAADMPYTKNGITISYAKASGASDPTWVCDKDNYIDFRIYANNTFTVSGENITSVNFFGGNECVSSHNKATAEFVSCSSGTLTNWSWVCEEDGVDSVTFTAASSGQVHFTSIEITIGGGGGGVTPTVATLSSISVSGARTTFTVGDAFQFGGICTAAYSDGTEKGVTPTEITGYNMNQTGTQTVTVKYSEGGITQTTTYQITVEAVVITLTDLIVTPGATTFSLGDPFSNPTVVAKYSNGSSVNVTSSATISGYNANTSGKQTITVSYTEGGITISKTYSIEVIDPDEATVGNATIVATDFGTSYPGSEVTFNKSNMTFGYNTVANISSAGIIQFKKQVGYVRNTVSINGLRSIEVIVSSGKAFTGTLYSGTSSDDLSHSQAVEESGTYFIESGDKFFKLQETGSTAGYLDSITVNYSTKKVDPTSVYFDTTSMDLTIGETAKLTAKFTPEDCNQNMGLTWTSSNTGVATVSNGTITAKAKGSTTITATSTFNSNFKATCIVTVKDISVTSVSLDTNSASLSIGATQQLYATINPSNATNQNVTWSSSNSTVASVSSTGLVTAKAEGTALIKVTTADGGKTASCAVTVTEQKLDKWTIMLYICGADLESGGGYATSDIKEILSTKNKPDDVNIIIQTGGTTSWSLGSTYLSGATFVDASKTQRWHVEGSKLVLDSSLSKANFGSSSTLQSFYEWGTSSYPAQKTGVIFWNHGGGIDGVCWDENYNDDCLSMSECKSALSGAFGSTPSSKLEWVGYDACLMQCQEIADYNSKYFNYMVASEESESGNGWDYDKWLPYVYNASATSEVLKQICYTFIAEQGTSSDQTLSYLNLAYMAEYKTAWENFASALSSTLSKNKVTKNTFNTFVKNNVKYYSESGYCGWGNIDAKDFVNKVAANSSYNPGSTYINAVLSSFANLVEYSRCGSKAGNSYGLCCVYKIDRNVSITSTNCGFSNWITFNNSYGG